MPNLPAPPGMVRTQAGQLHPISRTGGSQTKRKKFLVVLQYYEGDRDAAEDLAGLIADLERTRNRDTDIMIMRRADAHELSSMVRVKLEQKFDKVLLHTCRRTDAKGYPWGPNAMFSDLVSLLAQDVPYKSDYYAFLNLETDAVPMRHGWLQELIAAWKVANDEGFGAMGHIQDKVTPHLNGLAIYAADIWTRVGGKKLSGGNPQVAYDIWHAKSILPMAKQTPLIVLAYRKATITADELFAVNSAGVHPAVYHGVKDCSARDAIRARFVSRTDAAVTKRPNVYTYYHQTVGGNDPEPQAILDLWRQGWMSRGWNPIILSLRDAAKHPKFAEFEHSIKRLPNAVGTKEQAAHRFHRWLALDNAGGGLMTDYDALPEALKPADVLQGEARVFRSDHRDRMFGAYLNKTSSAQWIDRIIAYDAQPDDQANGKPHVTDDTIMRRVLQPQPGDSSVRHFNRASILGRKSVAMERFLRGTP